MATGLRVTPAQVQTMVEKVRADRMLSTGLRNRAVRLSEPADQPERTLRKLADLAALELPAFPRGQATVGLSRVTSAGTFWRIHARPSFREQFLTAEDFVRFVDQDPDPGGLLMSNLSPDLVVFPWRHSWLAPTRQLRGLSAAQLTQTLELGPTTEPPLVKFNLPLTLLRAHDVLVRPPCSLDSLLAPNPQWSPTGLASGVEEFIDGDVPTEVVESIEWVR